MNAIVIKTCHIIFVSTANWYKIHHRLTDNHIGSYPSDGLPIRNIQNPVQLPKLKVETNRVIHVMYYADSFATLTINSGNMS